MATEVLHVRVVLEERVDTPHTQSQEVLLRELRGELRLILRGDAGVNQTVHVEGDAVVTTELSQTVHQLWGGVVTRDNHRCYVLYTHNIIMPI